ncbi:head-tail connector protein [Croceicoccus sp. YJ47]|uniref:head-tail connector protein n=1 Tax=Croceicoccus sp. YJ47 TaxID=2798724 RepID=UPI0019208058|nr:head-tail connector protein [Croceicoccus sp. YJ47]QQN74819.1 phage gp6-like head-tail connector protein [Croceicoccus sp. YJ47]
MTDLVTLTEAKEFLRVMHDHENDTILLLVAAASEAVRAIADSWDGIEPVPARLKMAVLSRVSILYDERGDVRPGLGEDRLLAPLREVRL